MNIDSLRAAPPPRVTSPPELSVTQSSQANSERRISSVGSSVASADTKKSDSNPDPLQVQEAVEKLSSFVKNIRSEISFTVDESSGTQVVQVLDSQSKEVIRQIPSEEAIQLAQALNKFQGLFIKDKA